jgi:transportin-3
MAAQAGAAAGLEPVLKALATMQSNVAGKQKTDAHEFLEKFQKSVSKADAFGAADH